MERSAKQSKRKASRSLHVFISAQRKNFLIKSKIGIAKAYTFEGSVKTLSYTCWTSVVFLFHIHSQNQVDAL